MKIYRLIQSLLSVAFVGAAQASLIVNGDFESGNSGFNSSYTYVSPGGSTLYPEGVYTVDSNPNNSHNLFYSMSDHSGSGAMMMVINGSGTTGIPVWSSTVNADLIVGQIYDFSSWTASVYPDSLAELTFKVDGLTLGTISPTADGSWTQFLTPFTAETARPVFELFNANGELHGNDFALDDIDVFSRTPDTKSVPDAGAGVLGAITLAGLLAFRRNGAKS